MKTLRVASLVLPICLLFALAGGCRSELPPVSSPGGDNGSAVDDVVEDDTTGDDASEDDSPGDDAADDTAEDDMDDDAPGDDTPDDDTPQDDALPLADMRRFIETRTLANGNAFGDRLPSITSSGKYRFTDNGSWTGGFWPGLNLLCREWTGNGRYLEVARSSRLRFSNRLSDTATLDHDVGMLFVPSLVADYRLTGDVEARRLALEAAETLADRFNEEGGFIRAWNDWMPENRGRMIIDTMQNLPLLFWAAGETGDERYLRIASIHAETTARYLVRPDYTTGHTYVFDPSTGEPKYMRTHQGYSDSSCWARGQAWAIGGFSYAHRYTGNRDFLATARGVALRFIELLEPDYVPYWDLALPDETGEERDPSAAAIAAAGLLELADQLPEIEKAPFVTTAEKIVLSLYENYSTKDDPSQEGLLLHACSNHPASKDTDASLIYADYFFAEAVARLSGVGPVPW